MQLDNNNEYGRYCFYLLDVFFMVYLSEYNKKSRNDFPSPFSFKSLNFNSSFGEVKEQKTGVVVWKVNTGKISIFEKLSSF